MKHKLDLSVALIKWMEAKQLTQAKAAEIIGTKQSEVSLLKRGKLSGFTIDRLIKMLSLAGRKVTIQVEPA